ncbi:MULTISPECIES: hypothetical protein [unclassified Streptomyces]|uniref:hypothetical protein n=1 Tax=unclassified Streptomyces TaxID=2593676 RepID=UPI00225AC197|nr:MULTISPECIES: hypothetical protein [unclassified Streptomyces]MCX4405872.1 hypothetical protein [Streptomyces sp. NBC_01764]MCX5189605.1 hypothetical protein [Streptomyces sp. NBC_00268]
MKKKAIAAAGIALAGVGLALTTQGSAQAAAPAAPVASAQTLSGNSAKQPQVLTSLAARAAVHARAALSTAAITNAADHAALIASLGAAAPNTPSNQGLPVEGIFDK